VLAEIYALIDAYKNPGAEDCHGPADIRECTTAEILSAEDLVEEYAEESSVDGMPPTKPDAASYQAMEEAGRIKSYGAYRGDNLVGFIVLLSSVLPHYSTMVTVTESFFVMRSHRRGGTGLKLLEAAESYAKGNGSAGLIVSAPVGGSLERVMPRKGYAPTSTVFFKGFASE
jgi:GNAT superfamily N-acetyltransferase